ncbi:hypothetical protein ACQ7A6_17400, partial [Klebsiella pneumoniae]|uniref:hypothetical protein n=1 Tax=Klebsiella pneumoniae TaxID=573 RepID=UPI003D335B39
HAKWGIEGASPTPAVPLSHISGLPRAFLLSLFFSLFLSFSLFFSLFLNLISHTKVKQGTRRREAEAYSCPSPSLHDGLNLSTM